MARPTKFSKAVVDKICEELATSNKSLRSICKGGDMPHVATVLRWLAEAESEGSSEELKAFREQYARAREQQADFLAEEMIEIADSKNKDETPFVGINHVHRARLQVETRKWIASKLRPKKYGDKMDVEQNGNFTIKVVRE